MCFIDNPTVMSAIEILVQQNPEDCDIQIERIIKSPDTSLELISGDHRRGGLVIVKALPEPLSAKAPEEVNIRVLSLVEKKVWRFLSIQFNEGVGLHFPQLCIDKINQVQEIINDVQLNYVDNLDKFTESRCLEEYTTQFGINSLKKSTFSIYFKLAQCMSPIAKECMKQACSEVGHEISNQQSLDDLRKFLCEKVVQ